MELCEEKLPAYFIENSGNIISEKEILHYNLHDKKEYLTTDFLNKNMPVNILITSGASCPDAVVEEVIEKIVSFFPDSVSFKEIIRQFS